MLKVFHGTGGPPGFRRHAYDLERSGSPLGSWRDPLAELRHRSRASKAGRRASLPPAETEKKQKQEKQKDVKSTDVSPGLRRIAHAEGGQLGQISKSEW